jgi:hypothetical protein
MRVSLRTLIFAGLAGTLVLLGAPQEKTSGDAGKSSVAAPRAAEVSGRKVFRDPETGLVRPPEPAELDAPVGAALRRAPSEVMYALPGGGIARQTPLDELDFAVATRNADGSFSFSCAPGLKESPRKTVERKEQGSDR